MQHTDLFESKPSLTYVRLCECRVMSCDQLEEKAACCEQMLINYHTGANEKLEP